MSTSSNSLMSVNQEEINPNPMMSQQPTLNLSQRLEQIWRPMDQNGWCKLVALVPSVAKELEATMVHLRDREEGQLQGERGMNLEKIEWSLIQVVEIRGRIVEEWQRGRNLVMVRPREEEFVVDRMFWGCQMPVKSDEVRMLMLGAPQCRWTIDFAKNVPLEAGEYNHSMVLRKGWLASGGNMLRVLEGDELEEVYKNLGDQVQRVSFPLMMMLWNCRGALHPDFGVNFMDMRARHNPQIVCITETKVCGARAEELCLGLGYKSHFVADPVGFAGGIWLLWKEKEVRLDVLQINSQEIHAYAQVFNSNPYLNHVFSITALLKSLL